MTQRVLWPRRRREQADLTDEQLTTRSRAGDNRAFGELFRRHRKAAESTARSLLRSRSDADDVVSDAFAGVLAAIRNGYGPRDNFRRYLLACVRNGCRVRRPVVLADDAEREVDARAPVIFEDPERYVEANTVARAFASLRPRWQQTLWLTEVEQLPAGEVAEHLRLAPNATAALTRRAREAFATAYLAEHGRTAANEVCVRFAPYLAAFVRDQLTDAQRADVQHHLDSCVSCTTAVDDLRDVNSSLRTLAPAPGALSGSGAVTQATLTGTSIGGSSAGLLGGGLLLKGAAALLVIAPVLVADSSGRDDAQTGTMTVRAERAGAADDAVAVPVSPADDVAPSSVASPTTTVVADTVVEPVAPPTTMSPADRAGAPPTSVSAAVPATEAPPTSPAPVLQLLEPITSLVDGVVSDVVIPLVDGLVTEIVVPLIGGVVTDVVTPVVGLVGRAVEAPVGVVDGVAGAVGLPDTDDATELVDDLVGDTAGELLDPVLGAPTGPNALQPSAPTPSSAPPASPTTPGQPATTTPPPPPTSPPSATLLPPITVPAISVPPVTLPLNLPPVTLPVISVPPITAPRSARRLAVPVPGHPWSPN